jgi:hypothetical protein
MSILHIARGKFFQDGAVVECYREGGNGHMFGIQSRVERPVSHPTPKQIHHRGQPLAGFHIPEDRVSG